MHQLGSVGRPRRAELRSLHGGPRGASTTPYGWADLAGYGGSALDEATQALPVAAPLLTRGQRWRADHAGGTEPAAVSTGRRRWLLELDQGQWRGEPPRGRLRMHVVGISRSSPPGWVVVSGWRQFEDAEPRFCRVVVRAELVTRPGAVGPGRRSAR